jgi:hypothetical protein
VHPAVSVAVEMLPSPRLEVLEKIPQDVGSV